MFLFEFELSVEIIFWLVSIELIHVKIIFSRIFEKDGKKNRVFFICGRNKE